MLSKCTILLHSNYIKKTTRLHCKSARYGDRQTTGNVKQDLETHREVRFFLPAALAPDLQCNCVVFLM